MSPGVRPATLRSPAEKFLDDTPVGEWGVLAYLESNPTLSFSDLSHSWSKALSILKDSAPSPDKRKKAAILFESFKEGSDGRLAREWRDRQKVSPGSVIIKNSFNNSKIRLGETSAKSISGLAEEGPARRSTRLGRSSKKRKKCTDAQGDVPSSEKTEITPSFEESAPVLSFIACFTECYRAMDNSRKWLLPSGNFLEDILYQRFRGEKFELAAHSWVVDTSDPRVEACFKVEDWKAICNKIPPLPETDKHLVESMRRFMGLQTPVELRNVVYTTSFLQPGEKFDMEKHQGPAWIDFVMRSFLPFYENPALFNNEDNSENWYIVYIWSTLFDRCMLTIEGSQISRGESLSISATERKNPHPHNPAKRKRVGHLYDGVLKIGGDEAGAMEHAKKFTSEQSRKWVSDFLKVVKVLHDMLYNLESRVNYSLETLKQLPVVGLVAGGLHCQLLRMNYAQGHVCLLSAEKRRRVPTKVKDYEPLFELLVSFWRFRTVMNSFKTTAACRFATQERLVQELLNPSAVQKPVRVLPRSVETDGDTDIG